MKWLIDILTRWLTGRKIDGPKPQPDSTALTPEEQEGETIWATAQFTNFPQVVRSWPIVDRLLISDGMSKSLFHFDFGKRSLWPNQGGTVGHIICLLNRDGQWLACACDALKPGSDRVQKERSCLVVGRGNTAEHFPAPGETAWVLAAGFCRDSQKLRPAQRTTLRKMVVWP